MADHAGLIERLDRQLRRTEESAGTLPAKAAVKLNPDDWNGLCRLIREHIAALSSADMAGWRTMDSAPTDGTQFIAGRYWPSGNFECREYRWEGPPTYWNSVGHGTCIRPEYQSAYRWMPLPAAPSEGGR